jgi:tRNA pseudouridine55 synthase
VDGILNLDKPAGLTSFQAISRVRRIAGKVRVGHAGTLDPFATGILPVLLGKATRVAEYLLDHSKTYRAQITLGSETDTLDVTGNIVKTADIDHITLESVQSILPLFTGDIQQIPPAYSAIKQGGRRLYQMAREGLNPEPESRMVTIHEIRIVSFQLPVLTIDVTCGRGTYIRSLARDIGLALNSRGHVSQLERTRYGLLDINDSLDLDELESLGTEDAVKNNLLPMSVALSHLPVIELTMDEASAVVHGGSIYRQDTSSESNTWRAYDKNGNLVALLVADHNNKQFKPRKVFHIVS